MNIEVATVHVTRLWEIAFHSWWSVEEAALVALEWWSGLWEHTLGEVSSKDRILLIRERGRSGRVKAPGLLRRGLIARRFLEVFGAVHIPCSVALTAAAASGWWEAGEAGLTELALQTAGELF